MKEGKFYKFVKSKVEEDKKPGKSEKKSKARPKSKKPAKKRKNLDKKAPQEISETQIPSKESTNQTSFEPDLPNQFLSGAHTFIANKTPYIVPSCAQWFDFYQIHSIEQESCPEFFCLRY